MCRYTEIVRDIYEASVSVVYESPSGDMICFDYTHMQQGAANIIAPGDDEILDVIDYAVSMIYYASPTSLPCLRREFGCVMLRPRRIAAKLKRYRVSWSQVIQNRIIYEEDFTIAILSIQHILFLPQK